MVIHSLVEEFEERGRVWLRNAVSNEDLTLFDRAAEVSEKPGQRLNPSVDLCAALSDESSLLSSVRCLAPAASPVRTVAFNKSARANWGVAWHQDRIIAVANKRSVSGYVNWTNKHGTWHCEPPKSVLDEMLFVRVHLDDSDYSNGAMQIAVGSHAAGLVSSEKAHALAKHYPIEICEARRGDVLVLKMLTLHSSRSAKIQSGRRALRVDFSSQNLPPPLAWDWRSIKA